MTELRAELSARNLDCRGVKANLVSRLQNALEDERQAEMSEQKQMEPTMLEDMDKVSGKRSASVV